MLFCSIIEYIEKIENYTKKQTLLIEEKVLLMEQKTLSINELQSVNHIIAGLYDNQLPVYNRIINFLHLLMEVVYFDKGAIIFFTKDSKGIYHKHSAISINWIEPMPELLQKYNDYYCTIDDTLPIFDKPYPVMINSYDFFDSEHRKQSQYYKEYLLPNNCIHSLDGNIQLDNDIGLKAGFSLYRGVEKKNFSETDYQIVQLFQIHLSNVLKDYGKEEDSTLFLSIIENYDCVGVCILNDEYEVVKKNRVFDNIIKTHSTAIFEKAKNMCMGLNISKNGNKHSHVSQEYKFDEKPLFIEVNKITNTTSDKAQYSCLVYDLSYFVLRSLDGIKDKYILSPKEFEIILELLKGKSNEEIADTLYLSVSSVKKYLASIYSKMEIKNQKQIFDKLNLL